MSSGVGGGEGTPVGREVREAALKDDAPKDDGQPADFCRCDERCDARVEELRNRRLPAEARVLLCVAAVALEQRERADDGPEDDVHGREEHRDRRVDARAGRVKREERLALRLGDRGVEVVKRQGAANLRVADALAVACKARDLQRGGGTERRN